MRQPRPLRSRHKYAILSEGDLYGRNRSSMRSASEHQFPTRRFGFFLPQIRVKKATTKQVVEKGSNLRHKHVERGLPIFPTTRVSERAASPSGWTVACINDMGGRHFQGLGPNKRRDRQITQEVRERNHTSIRSEYVLALHGRMVGSQCKRRFGAVYEFGVS